MTDKNSITTPSDGQPEYGTITIEIVRIGLEVLVQTTRDGRSSATEEDVTSDIDAALPAIVACRMGKLSMLDPREAS